MADWSVHLGLAVEARNDAVDSVVRNILEPDGLVRAASQPRPSSAGADDQTLRESLCDSLLVQAAQREALDGALQLVAAQAAALRAAEKDAASVRASQSGEDVVAEMSRCVGVLHRAASTRQRRATTGPSQVTVGEVERMPGQPVGLKVTADLRLARVEGCAETLSDCIGRRVFRVAGKSVADVTALRAAVREADADAIAAGIDSYGLRLWFTAAAPRETAISDPPIVPLTAIVDPSELAGLKRPVPRRRWTFCSCANLPFRRSAPPTMP
eukprot:TRINITY_DN10735_c0_g1_i1.p1 TRINITY_DN10735_c0_g1~~TRINITY_DN10735_c0_g1_i1.p1  ORF type:complete len:270 (+),score=83.85 TRINITY_DN10735_c0_g1_i1:52-861(+)